MDEPVLSMVSASATRVLGEYDHAFSIGADHDFVILYGPNGVGKTKFLEIIDALTHLNGPALIQLPFETAELTYSDGTKLSASQRPRPAAAEPDEIDEHPTDENFGVFVELKRHQKEPIPWTYLDDGFEEWVLEHLPYRQISDRLWEDPNDGEVVHMDELRARYSNRVKKRPQEAPQDLEDFVKLVPSFLIETQRLRIEQAIRPRSSALRTFGTARPPRRPSSRITEQAEKIRHLLNVAQTDHSRITQRLDRKFPSRVLSETAGDGAIDADAIRSVYNEQNEFRSRLARVASVALEDELELPTRKLESWELRLLKRYLDDAAEKLDPFVELLEKVELLEQIVNDRLLNKRLEVTDSVGLSVTHTESGRSIPLDSLSSGEQHEIILMIDLLFNVPKGAVVLIDEPEISLHVVWQLAFIPDVKRISELAGFCFVVATHSPQIINDQWDRAIRLGPPEVAFS